MISPSKLVILYYFGFVRLISAFTAFVFVGGDNVVNLRKPAPVAYKDYLVVRDRPTIWTIGKYSPKFFQVLHRLTNIK